MPVLPKKFTILIAGVGVSLLIIAGIFIFKSLTNRPEIVVKKFLMALGKRDFTTALALVVPEERLEAKSGLDSLFDEISRFEIKKIKTKNAVVYDEEASVDVEMDFEIKLKSGEKYIFMASKETLTVYDDKTKIEVPLSESSQYGIPKFSDTMDLEKVKGKWYITYR